MQSTTRPSRSGTAHRKPTTPAPIGPEPSDPLVKTKTGSTQPPAPMPASVTGAARSELGYLTGRLANGDADSAFEAFQEVAQRSPESAVTWIHAAFEHPDAVKLADLSPWFYGELVARYRRMIAAQVPGCSDELLAGCLRALEDRAAQRVTAYLVLSYWSEPELLDGPLRGWIVDQAGGVNAAAFPEFAPLLLVMLWNAGAVDPICALIAGGIDTSTPAYLGIEAAQQMSEQGRREGVYEAYVQPLQHILGSYVYPVGVPQPDGDELQFIGSLSPGERSRADDIALGATKVAMAARVLAALKAAGAPMLTSFGEVEAAELSVAHRATGGTIWGFELMRMPFVQAAHRTDRGEEPVRMWELWGAIEAVLDEAMYRQLLRSPGQVITELVEVGLAALEQTLQRHPLEFPGLRSGAAKERFKAAFKRQATSYLSALASQSPAVKFATADVRGHYLSKYGPAMACKAGLWWAYRQEQETGQPFPVYYCLDGVKDSDIVLFKTRKTEQINAYLSDPGGGTRYFEVTTLAEIREILRNWEVLRGTVKFARMGRFVPDAEIDALIVLMRQADELVAGHRATPTRQQVIETAWASSTRAPAPDDPTLAGLTDEVFYHVTAQLHLLDLALDATSDQVLGAFLTSKGAAGLVQAKLLPKGFSDTYRDMIRTGDPVTKAALAEQLLVALDRAALPAAFNDRLAATITRFSQP